MGDARALTLSRRTVLAGASASLALFARSSDGAVAKVSTDGSHPLGVYVAIRDDNRIIFTTPNAEMGQGSFDGLARMLAEEMDAAWDQIDVELSGYNPAMFNRMVYGQTTGNSTAIRGFGPPIRKAGAAARVMLQSAAAARFGVSPDQVVMQDGMARVGDQSLSFGTLAAQASQLDVPEAVTLKRPDEFKLIGKPFKRKEAQPKITGEARFGIDVDLPNMAVAALAMPREAWGKVLEPEGLDAVRQRSDILAVTPVTGGYAVIAEDFWTAKTAADSLNVKVALTDEERLSSADIDRIVRTAATSDNAEAALYSAVNDGENLASSRANIDKAMNECDAQEDFLYSVPIWAHGALEPVNATALIQNDEVRVWAPHQNPKNAVEAAAKAAGLPAKAVTLERTFLGGSFGRKWNVDFVTQAVEAAKALPGRPVKLIWTREQDTQHDFYRPQIYGALKFGLDKRGKIAAVSSVVAGQSLARTWFARYNPAAKDTTLQNDPAYAVERSHVESRAVDLPLPMGWWRSVSHMPTVFFAESAMDELAAKAEEDPFTYRLAHMENARGRRVLETLREQVAGEEKAIGIAYSDAYDGYLATAIAVGMADNALTLHKIWTVADIGLTIDPQSVKRQITGGLYFGLGPALDGDMRVETAAITGENVTDIGALYGYAAPPVAVTLIDNPDSPPAGVGEIGTPLAAPALCNAIVAAGGPRIRALPVSKSELSVRV